MLQVTCVTCNMSHMLQVTNIKLQTILPNTQCVIYFWKAHAKSKQTIIQHTITQHNTMHHKTTEHNIIQHNTTQYHTIPYNTTEHTTKNTTHHNKTKQTTTWCDTIQHNMQQNTSQCNKLLPVKCRVYILVYPIIPPYALITV